MRPARTTRRTVPEVPEVPEGRDGAVAYFGGCNPFHSLLHAAPFGRFLPTRQCGGELREAHERSL